MFFKLPILVGLLYYHAQSQDSLKCANIWGVAILIIAIIQSGFEFFVFLNVGVLYLLALGYFTLLEYIDSNIPLWVIAMMFGAAVLLLV